MASFLSAYWYADFFGKFIFLMLFSLSIVVWIFLSNRVFVFRQVRRFSKIFETTVSKSSGNLLSYSVEELPAMNIPGLPHPFAKIYATIKEKTTELLSKNNKFAHRGLENYLSRTDIDLITSHAEAMIHKQKEVLERHMYILSTTVTLAPFLGLLGTVWGILTTFSGISNGGTFTSNTAMIGGISTALSTTVIGLLIAIPALIANNYLRNESKNYTSDMYSFGHYLLSTIEMQYRKVDVQ